MRRLARIDVDGTIAETTGQCKKGMEISDDGRWGDGPLVVSLAKRQDVLYTVNRGAGRKRVLEVSVAPYPGLS